jgi:hypothetical protein
VGRGAGGHGQTSVLVTAPALSTAIAYCAAPLGVVT